MQSLLQKIKINALPNFILVLIYIHVFPQKMDKNKDGVVTLEEFIIACQEVHIVHMCTSVVAFISSVIITEYTSEEGAYIK